MRRLSLTFVGIGLLVVILAVWITINVVRINQFTLLTMPASGSTPDWDGTYTLTTHSSSGYTCPFHSNDIELRSGDNILTVVDKSDDGREWTYTFSPGFNLWMLDQSTIEFQIDRSYPRIPIFPGYGRTMFEGTMHRRPDGRLEIKGAFWEKCLILYLIPLYEKYDCSMTYKALE